MIVKLDRFTDVLLENIIVYKHLRLTFIRDGRHPTQSSAFKTDGRSKQKLIYCAI